MITSLNIIINIAFSRAVKNKEESARYGVQNSSKWRNEFVTRSFLSNSVIFTVSFYILFCQLTSVNKVLKLLLESRSRRNCFVIFVDFTKVTFLCFKT